MCSHHPACPDAQDTDCYRAYKSIDPTTNPDVNFCRLHWIDLEHIANGIQEAGPELTPLF